MRKEVEENEVVQDNLREEGGGALASPVAHPQVSHRKKPVIWAVCAIAAAIALGILAGIILH